MKRVTLRLPMLIILTALLVQGCNESGEDLLADNPSDAEIITASQTYLKIKMDGGPLQFEQLDFRPIAGDTASRTRATTSGDTLATTYASYFDATNNLMITTTQPIRVRSTGEGSAGALTVNGTWGVMEITPTATPNPYEFSSMRIELFREDHTATVWKYATVPNAKIDISFPSSVRVVWIDRETQEEKETPSTGVTFDFWSTYGTE